MTSRLSDAVLRRPVLSRPPRRRSRKPLARPTAARKAPPPRPARAPYILTLSARRVVRRSHSEGVVPYLRMSGRWLEEHGFAIGSGVQVLVEHGRVTLISVDVVEASQAVAVEV
jgi:toxic protein SymE